MSEAIDLVAKSIDKADDEELLPPIHVSSYHRKLASAALESIRQQLLESGIDTGSVITWIDEVLK